MIEQRERQRLLGSGAPPTLDEDLRVEAEALPELEAAAAELEPSDAQAQGDERGHP
jgi:hypothetical protein